MQKTIKKFFEKKGAQNLVIMLICGVVLLVAATYFISPEEEGVIHIAPLSSMDDEASPGNIYQEDDLTKRLEQILSLVSGAGQVRVLLQFGNGQNIFAQNYQENIATTTEQDGEGGVRDIHTNNNSATYVMVRRADGSENPLLLQEIGPTVQGIIIVAQGANDVVVQDALTRAATAALGVPAHRVVVLQKT